MVPLPLNKVILSTSYNTSISDIELLTFTDISEVLPVVKDISEQPKEENEEGTKLKPAPTKKYSKEKLTIMKMEEKSLDSKAQQPQETEGPVFSKIKLKKPTQKPKQETATVTLPKFQLKSRITYINDWPPNIVKPLISFLGSVRQSGELSRNVKEAMKLKKKVVKTKEIPDLERAELEKPEQFEFTPKTIETSEPLESLKDTDTLKDNDNEKLSTKSPEKQSQNEPVDVTESKLKPIKPNEINSETKKRDKLPKQSVKPKASDKTIPSNLSEGSFDENQQTDDVMDINDLEPESNDQLEEKEEIILKSKTKAKPQLSPMKIERKTLDMGEVQHAENVEGAQFTKLKLKKTLAKPKQDTTTTALPKFQLKSRVKHITDWPPEIIKPIITFLGSIRQNGILSRNVKEAAKIKKRVYKEPKLPDIEKTELEKPLFGYEDIVDAIKESDLPEVEPEKEEVKEEEPEQFTIKPRKPSVKKTEEITEEVTIKKKLKPLRKSSVTLPEITEPETVTFRPKTTKTKEDVEQEFNIHLDSYAEEEISMSSKVKLKPQRQPTFGEEANEASIKFYEEEEGPDIVEIIESDVEDNNDATDVMLPLKKVKPEEKIINDDITSNVTMTRPKTQDEPSEIVHDVSFKLDKKPKYTVDDQEEVSFEVKPQKEQYSTEELSLSTKIKLKPKKKPSISEAADETLIRLTQEIEDTGEQEEIILSEAESEENVEMVIRRKPKKPAYEVSEVEELSVEFKPKLKKNETVTYQEEQLTISAKRKPRKPSQIQGIIYNKCY